MMHLLQLWFLALSGSAPAHAADSYRYLHVTIDTPWTIFLFLFFLIFAPAILAVILYWRHAAKKEQKEPGLEK